MQNRVLPNDHCSQHLWKVSNSLSLLTKTDDILSLSLKTLSQLSVLLTPYRCPLKLRILIWDRSFRTLRNWSDLSQALWKTRPISSRWLAWQPLILSWLCLTCWPCWFWGTPRSSKNNYKGTPIWLRWRMWLHTPHVNDFCTRQYLSWPKWPWELSRQSYRETRKFLVCIYELSQTSYEAKSNEETMSLWALLLNIVRWFWILHIADSDLPSSIWLILETAIPAPWRLQVFSLW